MAKSGKRFGRGGQAKDTLTIRRCKISGAQTLAKVQDCGVQIGYFLGNVSGDHIAQRCRQRWRAAGTDGHGYRAAPQDGGHGEIAAGTFLLISPVHQGANLTSARGGVIVYLGRIGGDDDHFGISQMCRIEWRLNPLPNLREIGVKLRGHRTHAVGSGGQKADSFAFGHRAAADDDDHAVGDIQHDGIGIGHSGNSFPPPLVLRGKAGVGGIFNLKSQISNAEGKPAASTLNCTPARPIHIIPAMAKLIDGVALAAAAKQNVQNRVAELAAAGKQITLHAVLVGSTPAAEMYAQRQGESCRAVGIAYQLHTLPADSTQAQMADLLRGFSADQNVTGIMLNLPLPKHLDVTALQYLIDPRKDVEGVHPANIGLLVAGHTQIVPCTAAAVMELIESTRVELRGAEVVVVGASEIVGKPVCLLLSDRRATVTICRSATRDLAGHTRRAEILVAAVGQPGMIGPQHVKDGAVVIDVGINRITLPDGNKKTVGDVDFDAVREKAGYITPVPGGVGPMTVAMLLKNTLRCAELG